MRLEDVFKEEYIITDLKAREKRELLDEMVSDLASKVSGINRDEVLEVLLEREQLGSTGIGYGVAIPHGKVAGLEEIIVSFARSKRGVDFQSTDEMVVHLFFLILAPSDSTAAHLKVLAGVSRILKENAFRKQLLRAKSESDIYSIIIEADRKF